MSHEMYIKFPGADVVLFTEGNIIGCVTASAITATLKAIKDGLRKRWHYSIPEQGKWLRRVVQGYLNYHSVPGNYPMMRKFRIYVTDLWRRALRRRSQQDDTTWTKANRLAAVWLPKVRVLHPWPVERFTARHPRQEPGA